MARKKTETNNTKTAIVYCRVSSRNQEKEGTSLDTQMEACVKHAEALGYTVGRITKEVYSGVELWDRPQLARDRADIKAKQFQALVCYATDRLSRDPIHLAIIAAECERAGCELIFVSEPLDSSDEGQLIQYVKGYAAKLEHAKIRERSLRGKAAKLRSGKLLASRKALYGYRNVEGGKREVCEIEALTIRQMYEWASEGCGLVAVRNRLFENNVIPPSGGCFEDGHAKYWPLDTVRDVLRNPAYTGETRVTLPGSSECVSLPDDVTPPIIDEQLWQSVQHRLDTNAGEFTRNQTRQALLRGLAYCAECGRRMYAEGSARNGRYYRCSSRRYAPVPCCGRMSRADQVEQAVWEEVAGFLRNPEISLAALRRQQKQGADSQLIADRDAATRKLGEIEREEQKLINRVCKSEDETLIRLYEGKIVDLQNEKKRYMDFAMQADERLAAQRKAVIDFQSLTDYCARVAEALNTFSFNERRLALEAVGAKVYLRGSEWKLETCLPYKSVGKATAQS